MNQQISPQKKGGKPQKPSPSLQHRLLQAEQTWSVTEHAERGNKKHQNLYKITYLPHKAVAEVSKDKEPIGRGACGVQLIRKSIEIRLKWSEVQMIGLAIDNYVLQMILVVCWFELQMMWVSIDLRFKWFGIEIDLRLMWFGCQPIWDSNELVVNWIWDSSDLDVKWLEVQVICLSTDVWFKWFWLSVDARFKWFRFRMLWDLSELVLNWGVIQMILVVSWC